MKVQTVLFVLACIVLSVTAQQVSESLQPLVVRVLDFLRCGSLIDSTHQLVCCSLHRRLWCPA
jgi:hypothetical protein